MTKYIALLIVTLSCMLFAEEMEENVALQTAQEKLKRIEQEHLLQFWPTLSEVQRQQLLHEVDLLDEKDYFRQKDLLAAKKPLKKGIEAYTDYNFIGNKADFDAGKKLLESNGVGCIILAGGQGTRLKFNGPKGLFPISNIKHKTLFQLLAEKTVAASCWVGQPLRIAIMTSPQNDEITRAYFEENNYFGLQLEQLHFFIQPELPFLDTTGNLFLEKPYQICKGPDGNGSVFKAFKASEIWGNWQRVGVKCINVVLIDNPLADPFDAELIGYHQRQGADITIKAVARKDVKEPVGVLVKEDGRVKVIEYSEIPLDEQAALNPDGTPKHLCANLSLYCLSMGFIQDIAQANDFPLHLAFKSAPHVGLEGFKAWKFERFIFDMLLQTSRVATLVYPREHCFAPLKNLKGSDSVQTVRDALQARDRDILEQITGNPAPSHAFELAQDFYYPTAKLLQKWKGRTAPVDTYIQP